MRALVFLIFFIGCSHRVNIVTPSSSLDRSQFHAESNKNMVASQGEATSRATLEIMDKGGNIIDAFITASFVISVERPQSTGSGGGG